MTIEKSKLLFIDSYDSFTYNLASLCRLAIPDCSIYIIKNDSFTIDQLRPLLKGFSAVIVGPGPGSPDNDKDIGLIRDLWNLPDEDVLPVFGVCLGLQSLAISFGARLKRLQVVKHGQVSRISHVGEDLFRGVQDVHAVRYHSLHVDLLPDGDIEPLAWADDGTENGVVLMAARHKFRPFWAVQYHPESVVTEGGGLSVVQNFWHLASQWSKRYSRVVQPLDNSAWQTLGHPWPHIEPCNTLTSTPVVPVVTVILDVPNATIPELCELLGACDEDKPFALLDSAAKPGRFSIIASLSSSSLQITHSVGDAFVTLKRDKRVMHEMLSGMDVWTWLANLMRSKKVRGGIPEVPFWGGLIGILSYELGVHSLSVPLRADRRANNKHYDANLVFVERSVVFDNFTGKLYIQSISPNDSIWLNETSAKLMSFFNDSQPTAHRTTRELTSNALVQLPDKSRYINRIIDAQESLRAGDSYELCLTANTHLKVPSGMSTWERYQTLRRTNPAPYSGYIRLQPTTFLSSSPERFLSYSRPPESLCQLRPIKGTVKKRPGITRADAEQALRGSCKEVAENLMIVDLIRHDLHAVVGLDVQVKQFCKVEEYETVWQMVSVIEGRLPCHSSNGEVGWEVLKHSLPPGSMTGAPKKRSVEILQDLEDEDRGIYSGVFGYWCIGGGGDWSVIIRSCFKHEQDTSADGQERWVIGAGGAITALSDPEAEWDEMTVKLQSVLGAFGAAKPRC
ncbi:para-aminobenzoate synthase [Dendrothele bispora CBS 962.96]|uniref:aminodeoxychorismate synthase n=1 Tax=Dendrothele bispora (strain CBS 962.96) TaxID=1314807 RepID=A0A4S8MW43_DENBC|nr:para-aminobenzoate synthase [Dendrothele bispora CBS 962.96]